MAIFPKDRRLFLVGTEQNANRTFTGGLMLPPVAAQSRTPRSNGAFETILSTTTADQNDQATKRAVAVLAAGALLKQIDLPLFGEHQAVNQLRHDLPRPERWIGEHGTEYVGGGQCVRERNGGFHSHCRFNTLMADAHWTDLVVSVNGLSNPPIDRTTP
jgi:hypothetical protein